MEDAYRAHSRPDDLLSVEESGIEASTVFLISMVSVIGPCGVYPIAVVLLRIAGSVTGYSGINPKAYAPGILMASAGCPLMCATYHPIQEAAKGRMPLESKDELGVKVHALPHEELQRRKWTGYEDMVLSAGPGKEAASSKNELASLAEKGRAGLVRMVLASIIRATHNRVIEGMNAICWAQLLAALPFSIVPCSAFKDGGPLRDATILVRCAKTVEAISLASFITYEVVWHCIPRPWYDTASNGIIRPLRSTLEETFSQKSLGEASHAFPSIVTSLTSAAADHTVHSTHRWIQ